MQVEGDKVDGYFSDEQQRQVERPSFKWSHAGSTPFRRRPALVFTNNVVSSVDRHGIELCLGPCAAASPSRSEYGRRTRDWTMMMSALAGHPQPRDDTALLTRRQLIKPKAMLRHADSMGPAFGPERDERQKFFGTVEMCHWV